MDLGDFESDDNTPSLSGTLLVARPQLLDPHFKHNVVLVSMHSRDDGALGVVINRPLEKTLGEHEDEYQFGRLSDIPLYYGGPVEQEKMILAAWKWSKQEGLFRLYFGITPEKAEEMLIEEPDLQVRGFFGYSGWSGGQLEGEIQQEAWLVAPIDGGLLERTEGEEMWQACLRKMDPVFKLLDKEPDDPSLN